MYVIGKTGTGKSVLLNNLIVQDIANGEGLCVVDPHGELIEGVLAKIPEERMKDVIYFNPADPDYHIGFNVLELPDPKYKHLVSSGLMAIFTKIWAGVWSSRMEYILNNCILALLDTPGSTLLGIPRLLTDKDYRQKVIANVTDPVVKAFWMHEFEQWQERFRNEAIAPIQNKVGQFLSTALIRNIVGQSKSTIDIFDIMNEGKIFLVNVSKGRIGEDNSALLGAMLITKIQLAAMERVRIPEEERVDFYLYVDEFQNFATDSFAGILSESRKYRLNLILAHQYVGQLVTDTSTKVRDAIFGNVGTMTVFRVGAADAEFLENEFTPEFTIEDIVNIPNYHIYIKLMVDGVTTRPFSARTIPPLNVASSAMVAEDIIEMSRERYAKTKEFVETEINQWSGVMEPRGVSASHTLTSAAGAPGKSGDTTVRYEAVCSSCNKTTTVPFEPLPGRPVYCRDCLKKIEAGELAPVRVPRAPARRASAAPQRRNTDALSSLGIEFASETAPAGEEPPPSEPSAPTHAPAHPHPERPRKEPVRVWRNEEARPRSPIQNAIPVQEPTSADPQEVLSLSSLKPVEPPKSKHPPREKEEIDINELRNAIKASLSASISADDGNTPAPAEAVTPRPKEEEEDYERDETYRR